MKRALTSIAAAGVVLGMMAPAAFAATTASYTVSGAKNITVDGKVVSSPIAIAAKDSGTTTSYFPIWYLQQALNGAGYTNTYNASTHQWDVTVPGVTASSLTIPGGVGTGSASISINGTVVKKFNPQFVKDPAGGKNASITTYFPIYYLGNVLQAAGLFQGWDGNNFGFTHYNATLGIQSVSALNADQIQVVFSQKVDQATAENIDNYALNTVNLDTNHASNQTPAAGDATASLQADGKTVIITGGTSGGFGAVLGTNKGYVVSVDGVKNADKSQTLSNASSSSFTFGGDTVAPTISGVTSTSSSTGTKTVKVKFSEPVQGAGLYYINGKPATFAAPSPWSNSITLTSADLLSAGSTYSFQVINEKDSSGNLVSTTQNFTVTSDTAAPVVSSIQPVSDNVVKVTFSKAMTTSTVSTSTINVLDANGNNKNSYVQSVALDANDNGALQTFDISFNKATASALFNTSGKANLTFVFSGSTQDSLGNAMVPTSQNVTLTLNTTAPAITSVQYVKPTVTYDGATRTLGAVVLTFNEDVNAALASGSLAVYKDNGQVDSGVTGWTVSRLSNTNNTLILEPTGAAFAGTNSEVLRFNAKAFTDSSLAGNTSAAVVETVDLTKGITGTDTTKPSVGGATGMALGSYNPAVSSTETVTFNVYDQGGIDFSSLLNTANYRLNGAALAAGSYVTTNGVSAGNTTVTINLPANSIATNGTYSLVVSGVKDLSGNVANTTVTNTVYLYDNTAPTLTGATFNPDHSVSLTFSAPVTSTSTGDFTVTANGNPVTVTGATLGTGADTGKVVLTTSAIAAGSTVVVKVSNSATGHDANNNIIANGGTTVSATAN